MADRDQARVPRPGEDLGHFDFMITEEHVAAYKAGLGLDTLSDAAMSAFGSPAAPSMLIHLADDASRRGSGYSNSFGTLWTRQTWSLRAPVLVGAPHRVAGRIIDVYPYHDRMVVVTEATVRNIADEVVGVGQHHQSYLLNRRSGEVKLRDESAAPRRYEAPAGVMLEPIEREITLEMCRRLFPGSAGYHTDAGAARELGFKDIVVGGRVTLYYLGEVLERHFGDAWWEGGALEVKFTNVVWPGDRLAARGVLTGIKDGRQHVALWVEKSDGTVVNVAQATLPSTDDAIRLATPESARSRPRPDRSAS